MIQEKKDKILNFKDIYGFKIAYRHEIENLNTEDELKCIIDKHEDFLKDILSDALSQIYHLKKDLGFA